MTSTENRQEVARVDLCRTVPFDLTRAQTPDNPDDGFTIDGYGAVFNSVTSIDSWEGSFEEEILPGAFKKSLREGIPKMQFDHGNHPLLGSIPLGRWDVAEEDDQGLHLVGRMTDNWLIQPFRDAITDGAVDGMSFRFSVVQENWVDNQGKKVRDEELWDLLWTGGGERGPIRRQLKEVKCSEAGPVTWPAYPETSVGTRSRSVTIDLGRLVDPAEQRKIAGIIAAADAQAAGKLSARESERCALRRTLIEAGHTPSEAWKLLEFSPRTRTQTPEPLPISRPEAQPEPQPTDESAGEHSRSEPQPTDDPAGTHSSAARRVRLQSLASRTAARLNNIPA